MLAAVQTWFERSNPFSVTQFDVRTHERWRLYVLLSVALLKMLNFFGGTWDIQWHIAIGRDNAFIPPHMLILIAFVGGLGVVLWAMAHETAVARSGIRLKHTIRIGAIQTLPAFFCIYAGYTAALLSGVFDEAWHRAFGIDARLWSPPHLAIFLSTQVVDVSLMMGMVSVARHMGQKLTWRSPAFWGLALTAGYLLESVCFQFSEAFLIAYRAGGAGVVGLLFPIMVGILYPAYLVLAVRLSGSMRTAFPIFVITILLEYVGVGVAAAGFAVLQPVSVVEAFVRENPDSTIATARAFASRIDIGGPYGMVLAWMLWLTAGSMVLVACIGLFKNADRRPWLAAPIFSASLVILAYIWFHFTPSLKDYAISSLDAALAVAIATAGGVVFGRAGLALADRFLPAPP